MIRWRAIGCVLGQLLVTLAGTMLIPLGWAVAGEGDVRPLALATAITAGAGLALIVVFRGSATDLSQREAVVLVVAAWLALGGFGAIPFYLTPHFPTALDAVFESVSGFTTTGATVLADVEVLSRPVQLWRCFTHWLGGMGIVLLAIAVLPLVGHGGMHLYRAEFSGAKSEKLKPRIAETAASLWKVYVALSVAQFVALRFAGLGRFDSLCHTFATMGTGGFSTRTASVAAFDNLAVEIVIVVFMILGGCSFIQLYMLLARGRPLSFLRDVEIRWYLGIATLATLAIAGYLVGADGFAAGHAVRASAFQVASIMTTTGFATENFELWHPFAQFVLLALMFVGGCTGSTAGGMKVARVATLVRVVDREFRRMVESRGVFAVRLGGRVVPEDAVQSLLNLVYLALAVYFGGILVLTASGVDLLTAISAVASCMFNVGPGLGHVGPAEHYGHLPAVAKATLTVCMIAGRLEFYTPLVIFTRAFWRR